MGPGRNAKPERKEATGTTTTPDAQFSRSNLSPSLRWLKLEGETIAPSSITSVTRDPRLTQLPPSLSHLHTQQSTTFLGTLPTFPNKFQACLLCFQSNHSRTYLDIPWSQMTIVASLECHKHLFPEDSSFYHQKVPPCLHYLDQVDGDAIYPHPKST